MAERLAKLSLSDFLENKDAFLALGVIGILLIMIVPLPTIMLDAFLSMNITLAIVILLISMYVLKALDFSIFPSMLLIATMFRLSLNVASTRLILLRGNEGAAAAGQVIRAFGQFVVGGNYVVGTIIFLILVLINFIVITKGAERIAEVAARFTLDAMPGKQMSIDADLNAGLISEQDARQRREDIRREADFYGAMDGAAKFVRGDAIAGIIITLINIMGGFVIGTFQQGLSMGEAAQTYTILTVGDGLVTQIPALIISTAAGIIITRTASKNTMGEDLGSQLTAYPRALMLAAVALLLFAIIPGLPKLSFFALAVVVGLGSYVLVRKEKKKERLTAMEQEKEEKVSETPEQVENLLGVDSLELEVGYGLIPLVDASQGGDLLERIKMIRRQFALDMGFILPSVHIRDNLQLKPNDYVLKVKGNEVASGEVMVGYCLAMNPEEETASLEGIPTTEPAFGLPALWIEERQRERAQLAGYTVVDPSTVVATHLVEKIREFAHELLSRQDVQKLVENLNREHSRAVEDLVPSVVPWGSLQKVLQNLLREQVPIKDLMTIVETLSEYTSQIRDADVLTEYVRQELGRTITSEYVGEGNLLYVMTLDPKLEELINNSIQRTDHGAFLSLEPNIVYEMVEKVKQLSDKFAIMNARPVLLGVPIVRFHLRRLLERFIPRLVLISHNEIPPSIKVQSLGRISSG
ncbi:MAG: flagellar biosynthesis protein FlhA [Deltaproteobacteria bacterium]|nr:flagellar biosynthesis protein FlhA [Candidatus Anaeroferrophillus wilburensis]MBN2889591.1 flagellar biosynthesis protein FlhA [Deltaproteobacteria bacterium]